MNAAEQLEAVARLQAGDSSVADRLMRQYEPLVWKMTRKAIKRLRGSAVDEDDIAQDIRLSVYKAFTSYDPTKGASLLTYCYGAANFSVMSAGRDAQRLGNGHVSLDASFSADDEGSRLIDSVSDFRETDVVESASQSEESDLLNWAIGCLPERYAVCVGRHLYHKTLDDVAAEMGFSRGRAQQLDAKGQRLVATLILAKTGERGSYSLNDAEREYIQAAKEFKTINRIASELNRAHATVKLHATRQSGLVRGGKILWLPSQVQVLRENRNRPWKVAAQELGISVEAVRNAAVRRGLAKYHLRPLDEAEFRRLHGLGLSTAEIGKRFGRSHETMRLLQKQLGLKSNYLNERWRNAPQRKQRCAKLAARRQARDAQRAWHLVGDSWPLGAAILFHVLRWHGPGDRDQIAAWALAFSQRQGWHPSVSGWHGALRWAKWLADRGCIEQQGDGNHRRCYSLARPTAATVRLPENNAPHIDREQVAWAEAVA